MSIVIRLVQLIVIDIALYRSYPIAPNDKMLQALHVPIQNFSFILLSCMRFPLCYVKYKCGSLILCSFKNTVLEDGVIIAGYTYCWSSRWDYLI